MVILAVEGDFTALSTVSLITETDGGIWDANELSDFSHSDGQVLHAAQKAPRVGSMFSIPASA